VIAVPQKRTIVASGGKGFAQCGRVSSGTLTGGGEVVGGEVTGGEVTGGEVTGGEVTGGEVTGGEVTGGEVTGGELTGGGPTGGGRTAGAAGRCRPAGVTANGVTVAAPALPKFIALPMFEISGCVPVGTVPGTVLVDVAAVPPATTVMLDGGRTVGADADGCGVGGRFAACAGAASVDSGGVPNSCRRAHS